jgi:cytochrome c-type biogenesis protein CcmH/NrfG
MARAATRQGKRAKQAPRPRQQSGRVGGSAKSIEQQLFFGRMRRSAKWVFAFLALVFAGTFVFLGVGSGQGSGLLDITHWFGGGGSGTSSVKSLQNKVAKNPKDAAAYLALGQALDTKGQTSGAIDAYRHYTALRPRNVDGWNQLAADYFKQARTQSAQLQAATATSSPLVDPTEFAPGGKLGQGLATYSDPLQASLTSGASLKQAQLQPQFQTTLHELVAAYKKIAALQPADPTSQYQVAQVAEQTGDLTTALAAYQTFVKRFPDDSFVPEAKKQIKLIQQQLHPAKSPSSSR